MSPVPPRQSSVFLRILIFLLLFGSAAAAQRVAVVVPEKGDTANAYGAALSARLSGKVKVLDESLAETAYSAVAPPSPWNMTVGDARRLADAIGSDFVVLVRAGVMPRTSLNKGEYTEAFAAIYLVSARSGRLSDWKLRSFEAAAPEQAVRLLLGSADEAAAQITGKAVAASAAELREKQAPAIEQLPAEPQPSDNTFRPPVPYRRIKPAYTDAARLYGISAVVEAEADIEADGRISRVEIVRWAGFGLDESVTAAIRGMNWRPAERGGKPLAMRVLLRYNFTRIEKQ